jgi:hypothetical protein
MAVHSRMGPLRKGGYPRLRPPVEKDVLGRDLARVRQEATEENASSILC